NKISIEKKKKGRKEGRKKRKKKKKKDDMRVLSLSLGRIIVRRTYLHWFHTWINGPRPDSRYPCCYLKPVTWLHWSLALNCHVGGGRDRLSVNVQTEEHPGS